MGGRDFLVSGTPSDSAGPRLVCIPSDDLAFAAIAQSLVDVNENEVPEELERHLRDQYPRAAVRERDLSGESFRTWYVYRDGAYPSWLRRPRK